MTLTHLAAAILVWVAVGIGVACSVALLVMRDLNERLHFIAPLATVSAVLITAAVIVEAHLTAAGIKAILTTLLLVATNTILTHATARAARVREFGHWVIRPEEREAAAPQGDDDR